MDAQRFDRWTAAMAKVSTRRATLSLLAGGLFVRSRVGSAGAQEDRPDRDGDGLFDDDETDVYGTDPDNPDTDGDGDSDGLEVYNGTDPLTPNGGGGAPPAPAGNACAAGLTDCGGVCVDLSSDELNCGACGYGCGSVPCFGGVCDTGAIVQNDSPPIGQVIDEVTTCAAGLTMCPSGCTDIYSDLSNCSICGYVCSAGDICQGGLCTVAQCPAGQVMCDVFCTSLAYDVRNCGACGNTCAEGLVCCSGVCVDISSDVDNCGACGRGCITPLVGSTTCSNYVCG